MNGRVLSEHLTLVRPETRVLFMSGYSDDAVLRHGIESASAQFIQKPFSMDALMTKMRETLHDPQADVPARLKSFAGNQIRYNRALRGQFAHTSAHDGRSPSATRSRQPPRRLGPASSISRTSAAPRC